MQRHGIVRGPVRERVLAAFLILAGVALGHARTPVAANALALTFYVATDGNDNWSGTLPAPNSNRTDGPFATLIRARDAIRKLKGEQGLKDSVTAMVREGKYFLDRTVVFGPEDSGTQDHPITYKAYSGETPILSGGYRVTGWKPYKGKILVAALPGSKGGKWKFRQLFFNGQRQIRARTPNIDLANPLYAGWDFAEDQADSGDIVAFKYKQGTFQHHWAKPSEGEVLFYAGDPEMLNTVPIKSIDEANRVITLTHKGLDIDIAPWYVPGGTFSPLTPFYIANLLEELDEPGEWCQDAEDGVLYFWPPSGSLKPSDEVVVPALASLIDIQGATWLTISGLTFTETMDGDNIHHEGVDGTGIIYPRADLKFGGDALHMKGASHCTIAHNRFYAVGGNAIYLEGENARNVITRNEISYTGADGICLGGDHLRKPVYNFVTDNNLHHTGRFNSYGEAIFAGVSNGNVISHNRIDSTPSYAINLGSNSAGRNIVEFNRVSHCCQQVKDTGAINVWMDMPASKDLERDGHVIRYNYVSDCFSFRAIDGKVGQETDSGLYLTEPYYRTGWTVGIYMDDYTSNSLIQGNIIARCQMGLQLHGGKNNLIENNVFVNDFHNIIVTESVSDHPYMKGIGMLGSLSGNHVLRNIFYQSDPLSPLYGLFQHWTPDSAAEWDYNVLWEGPNGKYAPLQIHQEEVEGKPKLLPLPGGVSSLEQWRRLGFDTDSVIADPLFMDPEHDDYRLKPDSPAFKLGFVPIDVTQIGPRAD